MTTAIAIAIGKLVVLACAGFVLYKIRFVTEDRLAFLSDMVLKITIPCLVFSRVMTTVRPQNHPPILLVVGCGVLLFAAGYAISWVWTTFRRSPVKPECISLVSFQNSLYIPLGLVSVLFEGHVRDTLLVYIFLNLIAFDMLMWSVGSFYIFRSPGKRFSLFSLVTPPVFALLAGLAVVYSGMASRIGPLILDPLALLGDTSIVLSMLVLGGFLARMNASGWKHALVPLAEAAVLKLIVLPACVWFVVTRFTTAPFIGLFLIMQAAMPSAASLPLVARMRQGNSEFISAGVLLTHACSIVSAPIWIALYLKTIL